MITSIGFLCSQLFGVLAIGFNIVKFTRKSRRNIILWGLPVSILFALSNLSLAAWQGAAMSGVGFVLGLLNLELNRPDQWKQRVIWGMLAVAVGICIAPPTSHIITTLPLAVFIIARLGQMTHSELRMRSVWIVGTLTWIVYFSYYHNYALVLSEIIVLTLTSYRIIQLLRAPQ